jgi:NTP pyrophosphatase (non-canonical NTP hydrolase)
MTAKYANGFEAARRDKIQRVQHPAKDMPIGSEHVVHEVDSDGDVGIQGTTWYAADFDLIARADGSLPGEVREVNSAASALIYAASIQAETPIAAMGLTAVGFDKPSADAAARDKLTGEWYAAEIERVAKERDEARQALRNANIAKDGYITAIRLAARHIAKIKGDDIGHGTPIDMAVAIVCDEFSKARDALDAISQSQADAYDEFVQSRKSQASVLPTQEATDALHGAIGIITEGGELLDAMKKHLYYGRDFDRVNAIEELGDIEFYASVLRHSLGVTRDEVLRINVAKLERRYKERFTAAESVNRDTDAERGIMEHELQDLKGGE